MLNYMHGGNLCKCCKIRINTRVTEGSGLSCHYKKKKKLPPIDICIAEPRKTLCLHLQFFNLDPIWSQLILSDLIGIISLPGRDSCELWISSRSFWFFPKPYILISSNYAAVVLRRTAHGLPLQRPAVAFVKTHSNLSFREEPCTDFPCKDPRLLLRTSFSFVCRGICL